eukprot:90672_1
MSNKKRLLGGGAAIAGIATIGLLVKQFLDKKNTNSTKTKNKRESSSLPKDYLGAKIELTDYYLNLLNELPEPKLLYKHFMTCLSTPRPSHKLDKMRNALKRTANLLNIEYTQDKIGNVCLKKKGSKGYENAPGVVIQCHMDMVCTKTDDHKFDFDNDPIEAYIEGEYLKANKTTLGADDGIGIAAGLALMEHPNLIHGPIELLITVDEESNMAGAINLAKFPFLQNKILINVDSEDSHRICIGCAGGFKKTFNITMNKYLFKNSNKYKVFNINISGLLGGHTGIQIHLGRANAIKLLCRILNYLILDKKIDLQLIDICGGNAQNAIPSYAKCNVAISEKLKNVFEESLQEYWLNYILPEFKDIETTIHIDCKPIINFSFNDIQICDIKSTNILVSLMMNLPNGVIRMSPNVNGLVQTSIAFTQLNFTKDSNKAFCGLKARSMSMNEMLELNRKIDSLVILFGNECKIDVSECVSLYPGWDPVTVSPALDNCKQAHIALFGEEAEVYAVHAGLECGLIKNVYPKMDCVSIGPSIKGAHSTDEKLEIKTVEVFYQWLVETVTRIALHKR